MKKDLKNLQTIRDMIRWGASQFVANNLFFGHGTNNAFDEAMTLVLSVVHLDYSIPDEYLDCRLTKREKKQILNVFLERIRSRKPAPYILGKASFAGLSFIVNEHVLIPRSPIAELIEQGFHPWVDEDKVERILDMCTGCGCIAIACAERFPQATVDGVDISSEALDVAKDNRKLHDLEDRVDLYESDLFDALQQKEYDIIVSNPPYVNQLDMDSLPEEYLHEPSLALASGDDGLDAVKRILRSAAKYLSERGILVVEVGRSAPTLIQEIPELEFLWLDFEHGGDGVFILTKEQLEAYDEKFMP